MKNSLLILLSLISIPLAFAIDEKEPTPVVNETPDTYVKPSGNAQWFSEQDFLQHFRFRAELEKLNYDSLDKEFEVDWKFEIGNADQFNYEYLLSYSHRYNREADIFSGEVVRGTSVDIVQDFDVNRIEGRLGLTTHFSMNRAKENNIYLTKYNIEAAPIGIKYDLHESDKITELSLSYLPTYNYYEYFDGAQNKYIDQSLLHVLKLNFSATNKSFTFSNEIAWKLAKPYDKSKKMDKDYYATNDLTLSYNINSTFSLSYNSLLTVNRRRRAIQNLPSTDHKQGLSFSFLWN
jgi:hypothetical protein